MPVNYSSTAAEATKDSAVIGVDHSFGGGKNPAGTGSTSAGVGATVDYASWQGVMLSVSAAGEEAALQFPYASRVHEVKTRHRFLVQLPPHDFAGRCYVGYSAANPDPTVNMGWAATVDFYNQQYIVGGTTYPASFPLNAAMTQRALSVTILSDPVAGETTFRIGNNSAGWYEDTIPALTGRADVHTANKANYAVSIFGSDAVGGAGTVGLHHYRLSYLE